MKYFTSKTDFKKTTILLIEETIEALKKQFIMQ